MSDRPKDFIGGIDLPAREVVSHRPALVISREVTKVDRTEAPSRVARGDAIGYVAQVKPVGVRVGANRFNGPLDCGGVGFRTAKVRVRDRIELDNVGAVTERYTVSE